MNIKGLKDSADVIMLLQHGPVYRTVIMEKNDHLIV